LGEFQVGAALVQADPAALDFVLDPGGEFIDRAIAARRGAKCSTMNATGS
jgi:hypothetical protein